jgi:hypothetical protein
MTSSGLVSYVLNVEGDEVALAMKRALSIQLGRSEPSVAGKQESSLEIAVVFTSVEATAAALTKAASLAESLQGRITLVVPQIVPYPLPLTAPPVLLDFQERRFRELAAQSPVAIDVHLYLCRDDVETLRAILKPRSLVVMGYRKRLWPTRNSRLARTLKRMGHELIVTDTGATK